MDLRLFYFHVTIRGLRMVGMVRTSISFWQPTFSTGVKYLCDSTPRSGCTALHRMNTN